MKSSPYALMCLMVHPTFGAEGLYCVVCPPIATKEEGFGKEILAPLIQLPEISADLQLDRNKDGLSKKHSGS